MRWLVVVDAQHSLRNATDIVLSALLFVTAVCVFVPFLPGMPSLGLDPSWVLGMNQAVQYGYSIGQDVVFTYGPYSSILTTMYHPSTDNLMILGASYLGVSFGVVLLFLMHGRPFYWKVALLLVLAGKLCNGDSLLFFYVVSVGVFCISSTIYKWGGLSKFRLLVMVFLLFSFGLLPLVKGTSLIICAAVAGLMFFYALINRESKLAVIFVLTPISSLLFFWCVSGQKIFGISDYFISMIPLVSGYTEAMALSGNELEIQLYLAASFVVILVAWRGMAYPARAKMVVVAMFFVALFLMLKSAFVRHDAHALGAGDLLLALTVLTAAIFPSRFSVVALLLSSFTWWGIDKNYREIGSEEFFNNIKDTFFSDILGIEYRVSGHFALQEQYDDAILRIKKVASLPLLPGSSDIYSYAQGALIASGNNWNPRPVFQSYSAYTPSLAEINRDHLLGDNAPDNVFFNVEPIDRRLPSLEDGPSWLVLLNYYHPVSFNSGHLLLKKNNKNVEIERSLISSHFYDFGDVVPLPKVGGVIFSEITINKSIRGKVAGALFKPDELAIDVSLEGGESKQFRIVSGMSKAGFLISPLIESTKDFALLYGGGSYLYDRGVKSIVVRSVRLGNDWDKKYKISFFEAKINNKYSLKELLKFESLTSGFGSMRFTMSKKCEANIDSINGYTSGSEFRAKALLNIRGWLSPSTEEGALAKKVYLILTGSRGEQLFIRAGKELRVDVGSYFNNTKLSNAGFAAMVDVSMLKGDYYIGLGYEDERGLNACPEFNVLGHFNGE